MVNDNQVSNTSSREPAVVGRTFSKMALLLAFAGGAFAAWLIITYAS